MSSRFDIFNLILRGELTWIVHQKTKQRHQDDAHEEDGDEIGDVIHHHIFLDENNDILAPQHHQHERCEVEKSPPDLEPSRIILFLSEPQ